MDRLLEKRVLRAMTQGLDSVTGLHVALGAPEAEVQRAVDVLALAGLVNRPNPQDSTRLTLTPAGQEAADSGSSFVFKATSTTQAVDVEDVGKLISVAWTMSRESQRASRKRHRSRLLVTDAEREAAVSAVSDGYATGRLSLDELNQRTEAALHARTRGDLDKVMQDLGDVPPADQTATRGSRRRFVLTIIGLLSVPFLVLGLLLVTSGQQPEVALGLVVLLLLLSGLVWLGWWAFRHPD